MNVCDLKKYFVGLKFSRRKLSTFLCLRLKASSTMRSSPTASLTDLCVTGRWPKKWWRSFCEQLLSPINRVIFYNERWHFPQLHKYSIINFSINFGLIIDVIQNFQITRNNIWRKWYYEQNFEYPENISWKLGVYPQIQKSTLWPKRKQFDSFFKRANFPWKIILSPDLIFVDFCPQHCSHK